MKRYIVLRVTGYARGWVTATDPGPSIREGRPAQVRTNISVKPEPTTGPHTYHAQPYVPKSPEQEPQGTPYVIDETNTYDGRSRTK